MAGNSQLCDHRYQQCHRQKEVDEGVQSMDVEVAWFQGALPRAISTQETCATGLNAIVNFYQFIMNSYTYADQ